MWAFVPILATTLPPLLRDGEGERPELSGPVQIVDDGLFRVHYTRQGDDAPLLTDDDENGQPDLVDAILRGLRRGQLEFAAEGWRPLRSDDGTGGTIAIDVYVKDLGNYGYAIPVPALDGSLSCFIQVDSGAPVGGGTAESVAIHELHHCVEFRYTASLASWMFESAATYEQYTHVRDPLLDLAVGVLYTTRLEDPTRKLSSTDGRAEYASFLWTKFWTELGGSGHPERLPELWETLATSDGWIEGLEIAAADTFGRDLGELYVEHTIWNSFACAADDGAHYRSDVLPCVADFSPATTPWDGSPIDLVHPDGPYTASVLDLEVSSDADVELTCDGTEGRLLGLVQVRDGQRRGSAIGDEPLALTMFGGDVARAIVAGTSPDGLEASCTLVEHPPGRRVRGCATAPTGSGWHALASLPLLRRP